MAHQAPEEAIANALFLYCEHWIECKTTDLEDAGLVIIAYLAGAGFHIEHEDDEMERANGETESEKETSKAEGSTARRIDDAQPHRRVGKCIDSS